MTIQNHRRDGAVPKVGEVYAWMGAHLTVKRIGRARRHAVVLVRQLNGATWRKMQPLPLPADARLCMHPDDENCDCARIPDDGFDETLS